MNAQLASTMKSVEAMAGRNNAMRTLNDNGVANTAISKSLANIIHLRLSHCSLSSFLVTMRMKSYCWTKNAAMTHKGRTVSDYVVGAASPGELDEQHQRQLQIFDRMLESNKSITIVNICKDIRRTSLGCSPGRVEVAVADAKTRSKGQRTRDEGHDV